MSEELKPCACGNDVEDDFSYGKDGAGNRVMWIECWACGAYTGIRYTKEAAIADWNRIQSAH